MDCLHLDIDHCSCSCGNKWTHSEPWLAHTNGDFGGTPSPDQSRRLPVKSMTENQIHYDHCFQCAPLGLGKSWINNKNLVLKELKDKRAASTEDLLA